MNLVIVESPTKAKTLSKFLGRDFKVAASRGHIRDLPKNELGVDIERSFSPRYVISPKSKKVVAALRAAAGRAEKVFLATDPDREGEAIAWHIAEILGKTKNRRVVFHEITKKAVKEAFAHPRNLDMSLVEAQQARRVLDRLVGYKLSPLLWRKIRYGLSAGRVQSVAVRLIVEREREREKFVPEEYWRIEALLRKLGAFRRAGKSAAEFRAALLRRGGRPLKIKNKNEAAAAIADLEGAAYAVGQIKREEKRRFPPPPFITSTLQRAAGNCLGFSAKRTMRTAQSLYEKGWITYHRTDSLSLALSALSSLRRLIKADFGEKFLPRKPYFYKTKSKTAQEAHEAVRPTTVRRRPGMRAGKKSDEEKLYELIWRRTLACQMTPAVFDRTAIEVEAVSKKSGAIYQFRAVGSVIKFEGWLKVAGNWQSTKSGDTSNQVAVLPELRRGDNLELVKLSPSQHFTEPPPRFSEASLIKVLEENGIGRPSTYAPIISTIQERGYVEKEGKYLRPEAAGKVVDRLLAAHFPEIVDVSFTARMEDDLDKIAGGEKSWEGVVQAFYEPFGKKLEQKEKELKKEDFTILRETEKKCPQCGKKLLVKLGKFGEFVSCAGFPECKYAEPAEAPKDRGSGAAVDASQLEGGCPECKEGELQLKVGRFGKFVACKNYPRCRFTKLYLEKIGMKCPRCREGEVIVKKSRSRKTFFGCSRYPKCRWASWKNPRPPQ